MNVQINQFIVISKADFDRLNTRGVSDFTESGVILYPVGTLVPVIVKGKGCLANADIKSITITEKGTTVSFVLTEIASSTADAAYNMYRNQISAYAGSGNSGDIYEDAKDQVIPGMYTSNKKGSRSFNDSDDDDAPTFKPMRRFK